MAQSARELYWLGVFADFRQFGLTHVQLCRKRSLMADSRSRD